MSDPTMTNGRFLGRPDAAYPGFVPPRRGDPSDLLGSQWARGSSRSRAGRLWLVQAATGALLLAFVAVHLVAQHLLAPGGLRDFEAVVAYLRQPLALVAELGLLASVIVHAVLGLRSSFVEVLGPAWLRRASIVLAAMGVGALAYGIWLTAVLVMSAS